MSSIRDLLDSLPLFDGCSPQELDRLSGICVSTHYRDGDVILEEGNAGDDIYLIRSGRVVVLKSVGEDNHIVGRLQAGVSFGELSFLDGSPRSATLRADGDTVLYVLKKASLIALPGAEGLLNLLYKNIAVQSSDLLRQSSLNYARSQQIEVELLREKNYFNYLLISLLMAYSVSLAVTGTVRTLFEDIDVYSQGFTWGYLAILVAPFVFFVIKSGESWASFGVTMEGWKRSALEGAAIAAVVVILGTGGFLLAGRMGVLDVSGMSFSGHLGGYLKAVFANPLSVLYLFHSYAQEFVARGVFQNALMRSLEKKTLAVLVAAWLFGLSHILYGHELVAVTVVSGFFFGLLFARHKNLIGVSLLHFLLGAFAFTFQELPFAAKLAD